MIAHEPLSFSAYDLFFREWSESDADQMTRLFDTDEMNRWTPLPSPFTPDVAVAYVVRALDARKQTGTLQLAVCAEPGGGANGGSSDLPFGGARHGRTGLRRRG